MTDLVAWAKAHQKPLMIAGAAGVAGVALIAGKSNGADDTEPAEQTDVAGGAVSQYGYTPYGGGYDGSAGDLYNDLQPELEQINDGLGDLGDALDTLPEEIGKNIPGTKKGGKKRHRPPKPGGPGGHGVKHPPIRHPGQQGPKKHPKKPTKGKAQIKNPRGKNHGGRPIVRGGKNKPISGAPGPRFGWSVPSLPGSKKTAGGIGAGIGAGVKRTPVRAAPIKAHAQAQAKKAVRAVKKPVRKK